MRETSPSTNGSNGRDNCGRFQPGNAGGPGNPHARRVALIRAEILRAADPKAVGRIFKRLLHKAESGRINDKTALAILEAILDRTIGRPTMPIQTEIAATATPAESPEATAKIQTDLAACAKEFDGFMAQATGNRDCEPGPE